MKVYTVHECAEVISESIKKNYINKNISVEGVVSSFREHFSGNCYFSLIDDLYRISCKINHMHLSFVKNKLKSGEKVIVLGSIVYDKYSGKPLLLAERVLDSGKSLLQIEKEKLIEELGNKGYFSEYRKKKIPQYVFKVGIITSKSGAVVHDIIKTGKMRNEMVSYYVYNSSVQGEKAAEKMARMINFANKSEFKPDVLIVARGGGAEEDFKPFNQRVLLDAVYNSRIPVISAIGHEIDEVLIDKVADYRASTPTQAAEIAIMEVNVLYQKIETKVNELKGAVNSSIKTKKYLFALTLYKFKQLNLNLKFSEKTKKVLLLLKRLKLKCFDRISCEKTRCIEDLINLQEVYFKKL